MSAGASPPRTGRPWEVGISPVGGATAGAAAGGGQSRRSWIFLRESDFFVRGWVFSVGFEFSVEDHCPSGAVAGDGDDKSRRSWNLRCGAPCPSGAWAPGARALCAVSRTLGCQTLGAVSLGARRSADGCLVLWHGCSAPGRRAPMPLGPWCARLPGAVCRVTEARLSSAGCVVPRGMIARLSAVGLRSHGRSAPRRRVPCLSAHGLLGSRVLCAVP